MYIHRATGQWHAWKYVADMFNLFFFYQNEKNKLSQIFLHSQIKKKYKFKMHKYLKFKNEMQ